MEKIKLFERIKETSQVIGEANISLNGAADGFSAFGDYYNVDDIVYYAITDGARYEVGSGQYITDGSNKVITRIPFQSTNSNNKVSFPDASIKEVFATYPGKYSVFTAPELGQLSNPQHSGIAFWATENILDYDPSVTWDKTNKKLNIDGEANVSGNVTVGGNVVVSGTMDVQGDVTFIDSSNVTIWDKQLELASMSGTALFGDGNIDDAGIVVKSTDTDKKWVWKSSTDAWSTDENIITSLNIQAKSGVLDALDMNVLSSQPPHQEGVVFYDQDTHTLTLYNDESDVALQLGQEEFLRVRNNTGATITNGAAILIDGSYGSASPSVSGAIATTESNSQVVGVATHDIENDSFGYITTYGLVRDIDTSHYSDGDEIFLSETLIGSGVSTSPIVPNYEVRIGHCVKSHLTNGSILVQLGSVKLGGGDLKIESSVQVSGVPFVTNLASDVAAAVQTDRFFYYDSGINRLYSTSVNVSSGVVLEDGIPTSTTNTLYNDGGTLKFNGSQIGSWFISDGKGRNEEITLGQYVHVSGLSGVDTYYNSSTNVLEINPAVLSGYFNGKINTLDFFTSWEIYGNAGPASLVDDQDSIGFLGRSGVETYYNSINKQLEINAGSLSGWANGTIVGTGTILANDIGESGMAISGWTWNNLDKLYTSGNAISGWANGTIVGTGNALANDIGESGMSVSGWANGTIIGTGTTLANDIGQSGMAVSGWAAYDIDKLYTSGNAISGWAWGNIDKLYTSGNAISGWTRGTITQVRDSLIGDAPATLNTLGELADAINGEHNFYQSIRNEIGQSGMSVSGWAAYDIDKLYTSGNAVSGWADGTIVNTGTTLANDIGESGMSVSGWAWGNIDKLYTSGNAVSGWAEYHIFDLYTSGMAISGWAKAYADAISSAAGMTNWNVSDGAGGSESITEGATVEWVGRSGIDTYYNSTNNELEINAGSLSGWANGTIIGTGTTLANDIGESGMAVSGWAAYDIDKLYTSGNAVSGWANGTIIGTGTTLANDIGESGMAISGWARGYTDANGGRTVSPSTTNNGLVTWVTSNQSFAVESGIAYGLPTSDGDNYSTAYPYAQEMTVSGRLVIADDSAQPSSKETLGDWDSSTDISGVLIVQGGATITRNLSASGIQARGGNIYSRSIGGTGGAVYGDTDCSFGTGAGKFLTLKLQHPQASALQASGFNTDCVLTWNVDPAGGIHGEQSTLAIKEGVYVNEAIPASDTPTVEDATIALDLSRGSYHNVSLGVDVTSISFSNAQRGQRFILRITQNASAKTVSWTSGPSIKWDRGLVPVMSTGGSRVDVYGFLCTNSTGTSFDGFIIGQDLQ